MNDLKTETLFTFNKFRTVFYICIIFYKLTLYYYYYVTVYVLSTNCYIIMILHVFKRL